MKAIYVGSFNPFHKGHEFVARIASKLCDTLVVAVTYNPSKPSSTKEDFDIRMKWVRESLRDIPNIEVISIVGGLTADTCKRIGIDLIVKGCRNSTDFESEKDQSNINRLINPSLDTILVPAQPELEFVSSTLIRTLIKEDHSISGLVNPSSEEDIVKYFKNRN